MNDLFTRGVEEIIGLPEFEKAFKGKKKLRLKLGVDPSSPDIHLGHTPALDCAGMIVPGAVVYCTVNGGHTKSKYTVQFCEEQREDGGIVTVACHPNLAERAARVLLEEEYLTEELGLYDAGKVLRQQTFVILESIL